MDNPLSNIRSPEDARAALANWKEKADRLASDSIAASEAVQAVTAIGQDDNGIVMIKLDSSGAIMQVAFSTEVRRMQPIHLERQFMQAYSNAGKALLEAAKAAVEERLSPTSPTAKALVDSIKMRFPEREDEE